jgi:hypothetical protein
LIDPTHMSAWGVDDGFSKRSVCDKSGDRQVVMGIGDEVGVPSPSRTCPCIITRQESPDFPKKSEHNAWVMSSSPGAVQLTQLGHPENGLTLGLHAIEASAHIMTLPTPGPVQWRPWS